MSKFNSTAAGHTKTNNLAGGDAYKITPELELVSSLLTSFLEDKFYESGKDRQKALVASFKKVDPIFAAKASIFARTEYGMRSVSHVVAGEIAGTVKGEQWTKRYFDRIVYRPDDMLEILSYYRANYSKNEPQALRKGFAKAFERFDEYQLAKYRASGKSLSLADVAQMVHPAHTELIKRLIKDELRNKKTSQAKISAAGKTGEAADKSQAWEELVKRGNLGYFELLRNLRNIIENAPGAIPAAIEQLTDAKAIKKSLVLPFRFLTAADEIGKLPGREAKLVLMAISKALDISAENVPRFDGETLVAIDKSGSMQGPTIQKAALFGAMLVKSNMADVILWDDNGLQLSLNPQDSIGTIAQQILANCLFMGGTNIAVPFREATRAYDRIVILTDEQSWGHSSWSSATTGPKELAAYRARMQADPVLYNWDLAGHGSLQFPENHVATLAGWSEKMFDIMKLVETDKRALVHKIEAIEL